MKPAILGGTPAFPEPLHVGRPNMPCVPYFLKRIHSVLDSRVLTNNGPQVQELETRMQDFLGVKHVIAVCNATLGLAISLRALKCRDVMIPGFTFAATAHATMMHHYGPVLTDVDINTHQIDVSGIVTISHYCNAIIPVWTWGMEPDWDGINEIAWKHNLRTVHDAAPGIRRDCLKGKEFDAVVFSLHATKILPAGEGGLVCTNNDELAAKIRLMINFGFFDKDMVECWGTNAKMSEFNAAYANACLGNRFEIIQDGYQTNHEHYSQLIEATGIFKWNPERACNHSYAVFEVSPAYSLTRDELVKCLEAEGILARRYFYPGIHRTPPYDQFQYDLPNTDYLCNRLMCLPTGLAITRDDIARIGEVIDNITRHADQIRGTFHD